MFLVQGYAQMELFQGTEPNQVYQRDTPPAKLGTLSGAESRAAQRPIQLPSEQ